MELNTPLKISEIDFRLQSVNKGGYATILAYKDARVDMNRLDAVYGAEYWQRKHEVINGKEFCSIGIWNDKINQWIWKQDCGTESNTEKAKGESSDAFKRAGFNIGIGRELYDYPNISVPLIDSEFDRATFKPTYGFKLKEWKWKSQFNEHGKLNYLGAQDQNGKIRFEWGIFKAK